RKWHRAGIQQTLGLGHIMRGTHRMKTRHAICFCTAFVALTHASAAETLISYPTLTADAAQEMAAAALAYCRKEGHKVSVHVLDNTGRTKVAVRDDGSAPHSFEHSL